MSRLLLNRTLGPSLGYKVPSKLLLPTQNREGTEKYFRSQTIKGLSTKLTVNSPRMTPPPPSKPITFEVPSSLAPYSVPLSTYLTKSQKYSRLAVSAIIFQKQHIPTDEPKILLIKRASSDYFPNIWEMPGGSVDPEDSSVLDGCVREVWEETGLRVSSFKSIVLPGKDGKKVWEWDDRGKWWGKISFLVEVEKGVDGRVEVLLDPEEHQAFGWFGREEVRDLDLWFEDSRDAVENAFEMVGSGKGR